MKILQFLGGKTARTKLLEEHFESSLQEQDALLRLVKLHEVKEHYKCEKERASVFEVVGLIGIIAASPFVASSMAAAIPLAFFAGGSFYVVSKLYKRFNDNGATLENINQQVNSKIQKLRNDIQLDNPKAWHAIASHPHFERWLDNFSDLKKAFITVSHYRYVAEAKTTQPTTVPKNDK